MTKYETMTESLAQVAVFGGSWNGEPVDGWHGIEDLTIEEAKRGFEGTAALYDSRSDRVVSVWLDTADAEDALADMVRCEEVAPDNYVILTLPTGFLTDERLREYTKAVEEYEARQ